MRLEDVQVAASPDRPAYVRLEGRVVYETKPQTETWWLDVPEVAADQLSRSASPWLVAMLPIASVLGEPVTLGRPVDAQLLANAPRVMEVWRRWYGDPQVVPVRAEPATGTGAGTGRAAAFFSRGIDSFFTALRTGRPGWSGQSAPTEELILVRGFERDITSDSVWEQVARQTDAAAARMGLPVLHVATNLRRTRWRKADFNLIAHGCLLAFVALCLESRFNEVRIASSDSVPTLVPWGSHPQTDALLSTVATRIRHHGDDVDRFEKAHAVAASDTARQWLRVCSSSREGVNCGRCQKCVMTMILLELSVGLGKCPTFPATKLRPQALRRLQLVEPWDRATAQRARDAARAKDLSALADAIDDAFARSRRDVGVGMKRRARPGAVPPGLLSRIESWESLLDGAASDAAFRSQWEAVSAQVLALARCSTAELFDSQAGSRLDGRLARFQRRYLRLAEGDEARWLLSRAPATNGQLPLHSAFARHTFDRLEEAMQLTDCAACRHLVVVGCGALPAAALFFHQRLPASSVTALEVDPTAARTAQAVNQRHGSQRLSVRCEDGRSHDYGRADLVYVVNQVTPKPDVLARIALTAPPRARVVLREPVGAGRLLAESVQGGIPAPWRMVARGEADPHFLSGHLLLQRPPQPGCEA